MDLSFDDSCICMVILWSGPERCHLKLWLGKTENFREKSRKNIDVTEEQKTELFSVCVIFHQIKLTTFHIFITSNRDFDQGYHYREWNTYVYVTTLNVLCPQHFYFLCYHTLVVLLIIFFLRSHLILVEEITLLCRLKWLE